MATSAPTPENPPSQRLLSIDALRGFDMFWIIGGDAIFRAIATAGNWSYSPEILRQLEHADWEGFRFYDLIFPLFLFMVGCVIPFSLDKFRSSPTSAYRRLLWRTLALLMLGMIYNGMLQFNWSDLRYTGVLQRIAICYGIASVLYLNFNWKMRIGLAAVILVGYWGLIGLIQVDIQLGVYSKEGNLSGYVDRKILPGKILPEYYGYGDNEGLLSTMPAIVTTLLGIFAGEWLRGYRDRWKTSLGIAAAGVVLLAGGYAWSFSFPIIKNIWSSSFVLVAGGWSCLLLAIFYSLIDALGWKRWAFFWIVIGTNAITIYLIRRIIDFEKMSTFFLGGVSELSGAWGPVVLAIGIVALEWSLLLFLYRQKLFLRV
jgi:predicted acyltransferase